MREKLPPRRLGITERLTFRPGAAGEVTFDVTFGYETGGPVRECFCMPFRVGTDLQDLLHQGCIFISVALQSGQSMADLARIAGEDNPSSSAHSHLGLIVRAGVVLDDWLTAQHALVRCPSPILPELPPIDVETIFDDAPMNDDELDGGISINDLVEEDGGTLTAMAECQSSAPPVALPAPLLDRMPPAQINGTRNGVALHLVETTDDVDLARDIPAFLRRAPAVPEAQA